MKKLFILTLVLFCSTHAQDLHEFSLHLGGGLSTLNYDPSYGEQSSGFNKQFGFGYGFFVSPRFGFTTGLELAFYNANFEMKNLKMAYQAKDLYDKDDPVDFEFRSSLSNHTEYQNSVMLQIPLMLQFQTEMGFYAMAGVKFAIPLSGGSSIKSDIVNSGYYDDPERYEYTEQNFRGFGTFKNKKIETNENFESSIFASVEMGVKWRFEEGLSIYTGAYFDYGLNNIIKKKSLDELSRMVEYNSANPENFEVNSMLDSYWEQGKTPQAFVTKIMPLAIGVKIKLSLSQGIDHYTDKEKQKVAGNDDVKRLESEKRDLELELARSAAAERALIERENERLAAAEKLLQEARLAYERAISEQIDAARTAEVARLVAETSQIEHEVARLSSPQPDMEFEPFEPTPLLPEEGDNSTTALRDQANASGEWVVQVAVVLQKSRAGAMVNSLKRKNLNAYSVQVTNPGKLTGTYYRVRVGYFSKMKDASDFAKANLSTYKDWWLDKTENDSK